MTFLQWLSGKKENIFSLNLELNFETNQISNFSDFGCSWYNPQFGFRCPYLTNDVDKGGNAALMAPGI